MPMRHAMRTGALALSTALAAGAASAQVTAEQVWEDWKALAAGSGQTVTAGSETLAGGTLTLRDLAMTMDLPEGSATATLEQMVLTGRPDGTVAITFSPAYRALLSLDPAAGEPVELDLAVEQTGLEVVASAEGGARAYDYAADTLTLGLSELQVEGVAVPVALSLVATDVAGATEIELAGENRAIVSETRIGKARLGLDATNPETGGTFRLNAEIAEIGSTGSGVFGAFMSMANLDQMLKAGFTSQSTLTHGPVAFDFDFAETGETAQGSGMAGGGSLDVAILPEALSYAARTLDLALTLTASSMPLPEVTLGAEEVAAELTMPAVATEAPQDFSLLTAYRGVTISDGVWNLVDPGAVLPRDPLTIALDLSGRGRWLVDIMNPEAAADVSARPGEIETLTLEELEVSGAGASLTGTGAFTFDNADQNTYPGMPKPVGALDMTLTGANGLLDNLVAIGLVPQEQSMGFRMMLGLFARPGEGEDSLVSRIEFTEEGQVLANGQRLR